MQAVILAAGKSTRTYPLTLTKPKPLLKVANKTLLEHNLDNLGDIVNEVIIVVGYKKSLIEKYVGNRYKNLKIRYVNQKKQLGTAHGVLIVEPYVKDRFVLLMGDDIYSKEDIKNCIKHRYSILITEVKDPQNFGVVIHKNNVLTDFIEKPNKFFSNSVSTAFYSFDKNIFQYVKKIKKSTRKEYEFPDAIKLLAKNEKIFCVNSKSWLPIVYPWDLLIADKVLRKNKNVIGKNSKIHGKVKNSSIGNNCIINGNVKDSIVMDNCIIKENSFVESSVMGQNVCFSGKALAKNNVYLIVKDKKIKVPRLGAIIGDYSKLNNVNIKPGCKISPHSSIKYIVIKHDV